jgi:hypothetical protein
MKVVGWSNLKPNAPSISRGTFERRVFWLKDYDPYENGGCPAEAVDPLTVLPGKPGKVTDRVVRDVPPSPEPEAK